MSCNDCEKSRLASALNTFGNTVSSVVNKSVNIIDGWTNVVFTDPEVEVIANSRMEQCNQCDNKHRVVIINNIAYYNCKICKCPLISKVRSTDEHCPIDKW